MSGQMSTWGESGLRRLAIGVWVFQAVVNATLIVFNALSPSTVSESTWGSTGLIVDAFFQLLTFSFPTVGALILLRQPRNRMGWLLLAVVGSAVAVPGTLDCYNTYALAVDPGSLPHADVTAAITEGSWVWWIGSIGIYLILLFPDGRLPTRRWAWLAWLGGVLMVIIPLGVTLTSPTLTESPVPGLENPLFIAGSDTSVGTAGSALLILLPISVVASAVAMVRRFRRAHGTERMQLKWLAWAAGGVALCYFAAMGGEFFTLTPFEGPSGPVMRFLQDVALVSFSLIPFAIGAAILRHRLYDIDVVIKRTLVYAALTLTLVLVYLGLVLTLRAVPGEFVGDSDLAVAASTLVVAGLFRPLRKRIQTAVDQRFFRRAYDANRTLDAFSDRLRQQVELDSVTDDLRAVVAETMQPAHHSLWLRPETR